MRQQDALFGKALVLVLGSWGFANVCNVCGVSFFFCLVLKKVYSFYC